MESGKGLYHVGTRPLTVGEAQDLATEQGKMVSERTIRYAVGHGFVTGEKRGRDWLIDKEAFITWLNNRPKPGRK